MANVKTTDGVAQVAPDATPGNNYQQISASPQAFGSDIGAGMKAKGAGMEALGKGFDDVAQAAFNKKELFSQVQVDDAVNGAMTEVNSHLDGYRSLTGRAALDSRSDVEKAIEMSFKNSRANLKEPKQQLEYDRQTRAYKERYVAGIIATHGDQQWKVYNSNVNKSAVEVGLTNGANVDSDEEAEPFLHDVRDAMVKQVQVDGNGNSREMIQAALDRADQAFYKTRAEVIGVKDPVRALDLIEKNKDRLGLEYAQLSNRFRTQVRDIKSVQDADKYLRTMIPPATGPSPYSIGNVKTAAGAAAGTHEFEQPETALDGVILAAQNLKQGYQGLTLAQIGAKWAPPSENNTAAWVQNVSTASGLRPDQVPDLNNPQQLKAVLNGIMVAEKSPADRAYFGDGTMDQGVQAAMAGKSPKLIKAQIAMDEAQTRERIATDYRDDPAMGRAVWQKVSEQYSIAKNAQLANQLQSQEQLNRSYRAVGDAIRTNPMAPLEPFLAQHPEFSEEQATHLREVHAKAIQEAMGGSSSDWGVKAAEVDARIRSTDPTQRIVNQEQLIPYVRSGDLNQAGWEAMRKRLDEMNKPGAEGDKILQNNFFRQAERSITLESELMPGLKRPGGVEDWNRALPVLTKALEDGRAKGLTNQQLMDPDPKNKDSVWTALKPFLPPPQEAKNAKLRDAALVDQKAAAPRAPAFDWRNLKTEDQALEAWNAGKLQPGDLHTLVAQHPEWGIALPGGPTVPVGGR